MGEAKTGIAIKVKINKPAMKKRFGLNLSSSGFQTQMILRDNLQLSDKCPGSLSHQGFT
jgi:hypothetical protein